MSNVTALAPHTRVLIAGCGDVGTRLGVQLAAAGAQVWGLRRDPSRLPAAIAPLAADLADGRGLAALPAGLDAVVYCAAADGPGQAAYRAAYLDGPRRLLDALEARGERVRRLLFTSSTAVYAIDDGREVDEDTPAEPASPTARLLLAGEEALREGPYPATVIRFGGLYGPGRERLLRLLRSPAGATCVPGVYSNRIHVHDAARALAHLLALPAPAPLYLGVDDTPAPLCEVLDWLAAQLGTAPPQRLAADPAEDPRRGNKRCSNKRLREAGFVFTFPSYREGYADMLKSAPRI